jgi:hypothetical protein
VPAG